MPEFIYVYAVITTFVIFTQLKKITVSHYPNETPAHNVAVWALACLFVFIALYAIAGLAVLAIRASTWLS